MSKFRILSYSLVVLFLYSCNNDDLSQVSLKEPIPKIYISTTDSIVDEPKVLGQILIEHPDLTTYEGNMGIEIRGASSQSFAKKSYGFETRDANNEDLDVSLLGFPEEEDWILYGPYSDKSLMRNALIYDLSREMDRYASRTKFVELYINDYYKGVYVFMEKLKRDSQRIDINKLKDDENTGEDLTGGYILKIDKVAGSNVGSGYNDLNSFASLFDPPNATQGQDIRFLYEYPDAEDITDPQKTYITNYIQGFETALASNDFKDPDVGYRAYIDVPSFIDFFLLNEISNNVDGYRLSTFMNKDKNGKLKMGPIWDFNLAFGNADYCGGNDTDVWAYKFNERCSNDFWLIPFWWNRLMEDPAFVTELKARWDVLRGTTFSTASVLSKLNAYTDLLNKAEAIEANFNTWAILGIYVWPNSFIGTTYAEENNFIKDWIQDRLIWLDSEIQAL